MRVFMGIIAKGSGEDAFRLDQQQCLAYKRLMSTSITNASGFTPTLERWGVAMVGALYYARKRRLATVARTQPHDRNLN
jgi:hypothetical protein